MFFYNLESTFKNYSLFLNMISAKRQFNVGYISLTQKAVAPTTGAWIETLNQHKEVQNRYRRSHHGSVD